ncbi:MAG: hypothetical protein PF518_17430 [Spirochaetaceae bacterium]|jgi:uncharacterized membrane protein YheB (UPF0754 family)|nr:hypothetical protein [Spirochaetaceae bacterium]
MNKSSITTLTTILIIIIGYFSPLFREQILNTGYFALSGAITNWLAIYMLFEKVPFLYGSGVIPLHFKEFKSGIKVMIMDQFFTVENIRNIIKEESASLMPNIDFESAINSVDYNKVFNSISETILSSSIGGMLGMFGGASVLESYREPFIEKIKDFIRSETSSPEFMNAINKNLTTDKVSEELIKKVSVIVDRRLDELSPEMVKQIIQDMIRKHLGWLVIWGGVFGGLIGLVMSFIR